MAPSGGEANYLSDRPRNPIRSETLGETFWREKSRQGVTESLGSDYMHDSRRDSLRESFFYAWSYAGKYELANDRPKLAMLAANVGYRYWTDILACYIGFKIAPDYRPRITARVKPTTF